LVMAGVKVTLKVKGVSGMLGYLAGDGLDGQVISLFYIQKTAGFLYIKKWFSKSIIFHGTAISLHTSAMSLECAVHPF